METENRKFQESLDFVCNHYCNDAFNLKQSARILNIPSYKNIRIRRWLAAAASVAVILTVAAAYWVIPSAKPDTHSEQPDVSSLVEANNTETFPETAMLEFENTPLSEIVSEIETTYGVTVTNQPTDTSVRLTLSQSGTAAELIETINDLLSTKMQVEKK